MQNREEIPLNEKVASVVLAGGLGTRLYPLTARRCKPGVCFGGKYRLIDIPVSNSLNSQIPQIFVISQYFASSLQSHLSSAYPHSTLQKGNLKMLCPEETTEGPNWFLGTADAVRKNLHHILQSRIEYFLILSGDQLYNIDLMKMVEFAKEKEADLVVAALPVDDKEATRMGLLKISSNYKISDFIEKPSDPEVLQKFSFCELSGNMHSCYLGSMGIYVFKKEALISLLQNKGDDFGKDLIPLQVKKGGAFAFVYDGYWEDIGTVDSYYRANLALIEKKNRVDIEDPYHPIYTVSEQLPNAIITGTQIEHSIIGQGCVIKAKEITNSVVGTCTRIGSGTVLKNTIIMGCHGEDRTDGESGLRIGKNCLIEKAVIDEQTFIGNNVVLKNTKQLSRYDGDGIFIRDGIIIVASGTKVPDGFVL